MSVALAAGVSLVSILQEGDWTRVSNSDLIVCAVLALDGLEYCSGQQGLTAQHLPLNVCLQ